MDIVFGSFLDGERRERERVERGVKSENDG